MLCSDDFFEAGSGVGPARSKLELAQRDVRVLRSALAERPPASDEAVGPPPLLPALNRRLCADLFGFLHLLLEHEQRTGMTVRGLAIMIANPLYTPPLDTVPDPTRLLGNMRRIQYIVERCISEPARVFPRTQRFRTAADVHAALAHWHVSWSADTARHRQFGRGEQRAVWAVLCAAQRPPHFVSRRALLLVLGCVTFGWFTAGPTVE